MTEKKKAILLTSEEHNAKRVYDKSTMEKLQSRYDLYNTVICKKYIENHIDVCKNAEYIFSTWGMEHFSEKVIKEYTICLAFEELKEPFGCNGKIGSGIISIFENNKMIFNKW